MHIESFARHCQLIIHYHLRLLAQRFDPCVTAEPFSSPGSAQRFHRRHVARRNVNDRAVPHRNELRKRRCVDFYGDQTTHAITPEQMNNNVSRHRWQIGSLGISTTHSGGCMPPLEASGAAPATGQVIGPAVLAFKSAESGVISFCYGYARFRVRRRLGMSFP